MQTFRVPHAITVTATPAGREVDWSHPDDCRDRRCEIQRRAADAGYQRMTELTAGRPPGVYELGTIGFNGLCLVDEQGLILLPPWEPTVEEEAAADRAYWNRDDEAA